MAWVLCCRVKFLAGAAGADDERGGVSGRGGLGVAGGEGLAGLGEEVVELGAGLVDDELATLELGLEDAAAGLAQEHADLGHAVVGAAELVALDRMVLSWASGERGALALPSGEVAELL